MKKDRGGSRPGVKRGPYRKNPAIVARNERIVALFLAGKTQTEIGEIYGVRRTAIQKICEAAGYGKDDGGEAVQARKFQEELAAWRAKRYSNLTADECHIWSWGFGSHGYGLIGRTTLAHRAEYCHFNGISETEIADKVIRHKCDNPRCVNPLHLEPGTPADNVRDMLERGRVGWCARHGSTNSAAKLTPSQVEQIRAFIGTTSYAQIGERFGVSGKAISDIALGKTWKRSEAISHYGSRV